MNQDTKLIDRADREVSKLLRFAGIDNDRDVGGSLAFEGSEPNFDSLHQITMAGAICIAAQARAVAALWRHSGGAEQDIRIDLKQAAAAVYPTAFQKQNGYVIPELTLQRELKTGFYPTSDGRWFFPTGSYPHLRNGALDLLECPNNAAAIGKAIAKWKGLELEEAFAEKKLTGGMVRSRPEWEAHPQGKALLLTPTIEIEKIGDSDPVPQTGAARPLGNIRVIDMAHVIAGPVLTRTLAEQGADVLRISSIMQPEAPHHIFETGIGKRNAFLELRQAEDVAKLRTLCEGADVFVDSWRPGSVARLGFSPQEVAKIRPGIIYVSVSAYGLTGPWALRGGFEQLGQSVSGIAHTEGRGGPPRLVPTRLLNDYITAYLGATGTVAALLRRAKEGGSYHVKVSLTGTSMWIQSLGLRSDAERAGEIQAPALLNPTLERQESSMGVLHHVPPVAQYSQTPARWDLPPSVLGAHMPVWLDRR
jgi:crotonobetainyl-CoA:carnitine CoA-transferase CaiB-like acyl-CoA transferase